MISKNTTHPVWLILDKIKKETLFTCITQNIKRGKNIGLYRKSVNNTIIAKLMLNTIDALVDDEIFPLTDYSFKSLLKENRIYHIRGIATEEGIHYLEQKLKHD